MNNLAKQIFFKFGDIYDILNGKWESPNSQKNQANLLVIVFISSIIIIEFARLEILPLSLNLPKNHFYAVKLAFDLLLTLEVLSLIFSLAGSVANSMGKQFEILSLILLRQSFKEFVHFEEPISWIQIQETILHILSDSIGAMVIFGLLALFYSIQKHRKITNDPNELASFVNAKKIVALCLLFTFIGIGIYDLSNWLLKNEFFNFFEVFYTVLIFSDILIVLISLRYNATFNIVFRNSGFAVATVLIRLALTAPPIFNVGLGISAIVLSIGLTYIYNLFPVFTLKSEMHLDSNQNVEIST